jgi:hypothetical protein
MLKSIGLLILFSVVAYFHVPQLIKEKLVRELVIFTVLMIFVTGVAIAQINRIALPNPLELITITMEPLNKMLTSLNK